MTTPQAFIAQAAQEYGADPGVLTEMARLESGFNPGSVNNWDSNAQAGMPSKGLFQFIQPTFQAFAPQAQRANPAAWRGVSMNWLDPRAQALTAAWAIEHGHSGDWSTYKRALAAAGHSPSPAQRQMPRQPVYQPQFVSSTPMQTKMPALPASLIFGEGDALGQQIASSQKFRQGLLSQPWYHIQPRAIPVQSPVFNPPSGGHAAPFSGGLHSFKDIEKLGSRFGLNVQGAFETTGGHHAPGSYHYQGRAVDFGDATNSKQDLYALAAYAHAHPGRFKELFYNPLGWGIENGHIVKGLTVAGHDDHLHVAV